MSYVKKGIVYCMHNISNKASIVKASVSAIDKAGHMAHNRYVSTPLKMGPRVGAGEEPHAWPRA